MSTKIIFLFFAFQQFVGWSQVDFNNYSTLSAKGSVPLDFRISTYQKIQARMDSSNLGIKNTINQYEFLDRSMYSINEILHSGYVIFGDQLTEHIKKIASLLLKDDPELFNYLRFYTIKSDQANAFSTDEGIIFVTTGLISQMNNDAELAYVLCHEIVHFTEKHVVNYFKWAKSGPRNLSWISDMSKYSRENEYEADNLAVDILKKAGFSKKAFNGVFDVLLYSYLPFDEIPLSADYFQTEKLTVPPNLLLKETYPVRTRENIDDSQSTHPNIAKRRAAVEKKTATLDTNWGTIEYISSEEEFLEIRKIARFESVRIQIIENQYSKALYSIYVLEMNEPNSIYLKRMKAQCWLGIVQFFNAGKKSIVVPAKKYYEGESASMHYFISNLSKKSLNAYALRVVHDLNSSVSDKEINAIYNALIVQTAKNNQFKLSTFSNKSISAIDTIDTLKVNEPEVITKYDKISTSKLNKKVNAIDSSNYFSNGIYDIVSDSSFLKIYTESRDLQAQILAENEKYTKMSSRQFRKYSNRHRFDELRVEESQFIVMEPKAISQYKNREIDNVRSESYENAFREAYEIASIESGTKIDLISKAKLTENDVEAYNQQNSLNVQLSHFLGTEHLLPFPIDYTENKKLIEKYGTSNVLFSLINHSYNENINKALVLASLGFAISAPFFLPIYLPIKIMSANHVSLTLLLINLETGKEIIYTTQHYNDSVKKNEVAAHLYILFKNIQLSK